MRAAPIENMLLPIANFFVKDKLPSCFFLSVTWCLGDFVAIKFLPLRHKDTKNHKESRANNYMEIKSLSEKK